MPSTETSNQRDVAFDPSNLLARFGLQSFRPGQQEVVQSVLEGRDVLCVMPTGGGKSLCYQLPSLALPGTTIVVSPLIALMKDQVDVLRQRGIAAALINSSLTPAEQAETMRRMAEGQYDLIYVAPERLRNARFLESVAEAQVSLLAVDEAHCISEWGHDFRPDYARLGLFRRRYLGAVQTIALTATATPTVREDICKLLELGEPKMFVTGFARENLRFEVESCRGEREKDEWLERYLGQQPGTGIIYAATRKRCEQLAGWLPEKIRRPIGVYHAGLEPAQRQRVQEEFMAGKYSAIVATNAFGMGIDKSDLRFVVHYNMPGTLEAYYQEAGRAGRDGLDSECVLLFSYADRHIQEFFIENRYPTETLVRKVFEFLLRRTEDPIELTLAEVRDAIDKQASAEAIGTAESLLAKSGVLKRLDSGSNQAIVRIDSDLPTLVDLLPREAKLRRRVMKVVEKVVGNHRHEDVYVRPQRLCELADVKRDQLSRVLRELSGLNAFDYVPPFRGRAVHVRRRDLNFDELQIDFAELEQRKQAEYEKLEAVIGFARTARCRQREILGYFGDSESHHCGRCDRCQRVNPRLAQAAGKSVEAINARRDALIADPDFQRGVRVVLSGVARTHGRFGKGLIAQMLCGSQNKRMQQWKLNRLSTYGMLSGLKQTQVTELIDDLAAVGLIEQVEVEQRRPTVSLTDQGKEVMMGRQPLPDSLGTSHPLAKQVARVASRLETADVTGRGAGPTVSADRGSAASPSETEPDADGNRGTESTEGPDDSLDSGDDELIDVLVGRLKRWRRRVAAAAGMPAFRVLTNATLERIAHVAPRSVAQLEEISGVGPATIEAYGFDLIELVAHATDPAAEPQGAESDGTEPVGPEPDGAETDLEARGPEDPGGSLAATAEPATAEDSRRQANPQSPADAAGLSGDGRSNHLDDSYWTWRLLSDGFAPEEIEAIRRQDREQILRDLIAEVRSGREVDDQWFEADSALHLAGRLAGQGGQDDTISTLWSAWQQLAPVNRRG